MTTTQQVITMGKKTTGFALLTPEERSALGRRGGLAAQAAGKGRAFTSETALAANLKRRSNTTSSGSGVSVTA